MLEKNIEKKCCDYAKKNGYTVQKVQFIGERGCPDRLFYKENKIFFVEFKTTKGVISKLQKYQIEKLLKSIDVFIINNFEDFKNIIG